MDDWELMDDSGSDAEFTFKKAGEAEFEDEQIVTKVEQKVNIESNIKTQAKNAEKVFYSDFHKYPDLTNFHSKNVRKKLTMMPVSYTHLRAHET